MSIQEFTTSEMIEVLKEEIMLDLRAKGLTSLEGIRNSKIKSDYEKLICSGMSVDDAIKSIQEKKYETFITKPYKPRLKTILKIVNQKKEEE